MCDCLQLEINNGGGSAFYVEPITGQYNGAPYWYFNHNGTDIYIWSVDATGSAWVYGAQLGFGTDYGRYTPPTATLCPESPLSPNPVDPSQGWSQVPVPIPNLKTFTTTGVPCPEPNCGQEDRHKAEYKSIKLPTDFVEENRGLKECCCEYMVLAISRS